MMMTMISSWASMLLLVALGAAMQPANLRGPDLTVTLGTPRPTFMYWYAHHTKGRGIWKWNNALEAYQRHFSYYVNKKVKLGEVGVQSGGSIEMWQDVLGDQCHVYGIDINPNTKGFEQAGRTTITMLDQGKKELWQNYFKEVTPSLDILVDDGGHEPHQMMTTLTEVWPKLNPGGLISIEDIHGVDKYLQSFFVPAAHFLGEQARQNGDLGSVHMYPFVLIAQRAGHPEGEAKNNTLRFAGRAVQVSEFNQIWDAIPQNWGNHIVLRNPSWGPFLTPSGIENFFVQFQNLHLGNWYDSPKGCQFTSVADCTNRVNNCQAQQWITGIHIFDDQLVVEVPRKPVVIEAVRRGDTWIGYGL